MIHLKKTKNNGNLMTVKLNIVFLLYKVIINYFDRVIIKGPRHVRQRGIRHIKPIAYFSRHTL